MVTRYTILTSKYISSRNKCSFKAWTEWPKIKTLSFFSLRIPSKFLLLIIHSISRRIKKEKREKDWNIRNIDFSLFISEKKEFASRFHQQKAREMNRLKMPPLCKQKPKRRKNEKYQSTYLFLREFFGEKRLKENKKTNLEIHRCWNNTHELSFKALERSFLARKVNRIVIRDGR